ncbi:MAG: SufD family Fe-S cluster assembly protein [Candidatus Altiarchaeota archaeon]|nr:SufD family Fe-S cluster assembly protein [Candidatus Altiarchaeota archaeon]
MSDYKFLKDLPEKILLESTKAGVVGDEDERSASFYHIDQRTVYSEINREFEGQVEILDVKDALKRYEWLNQYLWSAVDKDADEITREVSEEYSGGYFMRIMKGAQVDFPLQSCLMMTKKNIRQKVHNIIVAEEGSSARIISGCVTSHGIGGQHLGISEFYMKKNASLNFTMIHNWDEKTVVRPKSAAVIEEGGSFVSNYICIHPVKDLVMYPKAYCVGEGSRARFNNIIYLNDNSKLSAGSLIDLRAPGSSGEIISRNIVKDNAEAIAPAKLLGNAPKVKAHMECRGLILNDGAVVQAIPELYSRYQDVEMSHEAAVGKIADKEINYLMSRGLNRDDATSLIVRGFLDVDILGLPKNLKNEVESIVDKLTEGM